MQAIIGNKKLIPTTVSLIPSRFGNSVNLNGIYYEFIKPNESIYPLELALNQIPVLKKYELVFIEDIENESFIGVFLKNPNRKTISIGKSNFFVQLIRFKELIQNIAIINNTEILNNEDSDLILNRVDFIAIEKLPELIDPNKKKALIRKYFYIFFFMFTSLMFINYQYDKLVFETETSKQRLSSLVNTHEELIKKINSQSIPLLPNEELKKQELMKIFAQIDNGEIK